MWRQDPACNFKPISVEESIKLHPESNSIRFKLYVHGYVYAYVIGDFNNWEKIEKFKLSWEVDHNDGKLKMINEVYFDENNRLAPGTHEYSYILVDIDGNETRLSAKHDTYETFNFIWDEVIQHFKIKSSAECITPGSGLNLIAVKSLGYYHEEIIAATWSFSPSHPGISLVNGRLLLDNNINDLAQITISCTQIESGLSAERTFQIIQSSRTGKLVHFIKSDSLYSGDNFIWELWTYDKDSIVDIVEFSGNSDFGVTALCQKNHMIIRKKSWSVEWHNDWAEQTISFALDDVEDNCYIIYGDPKIYTSLSDVITQINPKVEYAVIDDKSKITAYLSHEPLIGITFDLYINSIKQNSVIAFIKDEKKQVIFTSLPKSIAANALVEIRPNHTFLPCKVIMGDYLDSFYYPYNDMGVTFSDSNITLRLWAPTATKVELLLYNNPINELDEFERCFQLHAETESGTYSIKISRLEFENKFYLYRLYFDDIDQNGNFYVRITHAVDPYAFAVGVNGDKGVLLDLDKAELLPEGWINDVKPQLDKKEDVIIYETHLRDFTIMPDSGVSQELRGKYLGASESGCNYLDVSKNISVTTGIDSLIELGITHVHLLPLFDFSSVDETKPDDKDNRNWGYDPKNYNVPEGSYATDPYTPGARIKELRQMVHGFHQQGVRVVMDVVYNHMACTKNLDNIVPGYYFRTDELGRYTNGSGCGNEMATERPMVGKLILDSLLHWLKDYKIDGFRLDLMELIDINTMKKIVATIQEIDPSILIYGEPWNGGYTQLSNGTHRGCQKNEGFSIFNDVFRDAIRGSNNPGNGFVNGGQHNALNAWNIIEGLKGSINGLTANALESVNYADAHDNYTLWDHIEKSQNHNIPQNHFRENLPVDILTSTLVRQNLLAVGIVLTAQGIPFLHGGVEILRTKQGDHNSYKSSDAVNAFHWQDKAKFKNVFDYIKGLIKLRKSHPAFRMSDKEMIEKHLSIHFAHHDERAGVITSHFKQHANGDSWKDIFIIYNGTSIDSYAINDLLPIPDSGQWHIVVNHETTGTDTIFQGAIGTLPPMKSYSIMVLHS